jgi:hypothetical protein
MPSNWLVANEGNFPEFGFGGSMDLMPATVLEFTFSFPLLAAKEFLWLFLISGSETDLMKDQRPVNES